MGFAAGKFDLEIDPERRRCIRTGSKAVSPGFIQRVKKKKANICFRENFRLTGAAYAAFFPSSSSSCHYYIISFRLFGWID